MKLYRYYRLLLLCLLVLSFFWAPLPHCDHFWSDDSCPGCLLKLSFSGSNITAIVILLLFLLPFFLSPVYRYKLPVSVSRRYDSRAPPLI